MGLMMKSLILMGYCQNHKMIQIQMINQNCHKSNLKTKIEILVIIKVHKKIRRGFHWMTNFYNKIKEFTNLIKIKKEFKKRTSFQTKDN